MPTTKLVIKDEVNCKFEGLDLEMRKKLVKRFKYELPYARHLPAVRLGRWDGTVSYFQLGGSTFINLLPEIIVELEKCNWEIEVVDQRPSSPSFEFDLIEQDSYSHINWPKGHPAAGTPITLRDYQIEAINNYLKNPQCLQELATGAGKTIVTAVLSNQVEKYGRSIIIVPNKGLVMQTEADYINLGLDVGVYFGDRKDYNKAHTICTWQSLNNLLKKSKEDDLEIDIDDFLEGVVAVVVDECFDGDTNILTPTGSKKIKDLRPGDTIINYSESTKSFKEDTVVKLHENLVKSFSEPMLELKFDTGQTIKVTANHKFLTIDHGWVRADQLTNEMDVVGVSFAKIVGRTEIEKPKIVYNLHIQNDHNYVANGAVAANCHQVKADILKTLLTGVMAKIPLRWGLTGTIPKEQFEFKALQCSIGEVINKLSASELQEQGVLANCHVNILQTQETQEYKTYQTEMQHLVTNPDRLGWIASSVEAWRLTGNTLILVDRITTGKELADRINDSVFVSGNTKAGDRKDQYDEISTANNKVIIATYGVAAVGINIPRIFNLVLVEPGKSFVRVVQSIGRGIRKAEDKDFVQIWDITSRCKFSKRHLAKRKQIYKDANYPHTVTKIDIN